MAVYIPKKGDLVSYFFSASLGHEQTGRRPALVISNDLFNEKTGMVVLCPITNTDRGYPFHISIPEGNKVLGVVMVDQLKAVDYEGRRLSFLDKAPTDLLEEVMEVLNRMMN